MAPFSGPRGTDVGSEIASATTAIPVAVSIAPSKMKAATIRKSDRNSVSAEGHGDAVAMTVSVALTVSVAVGADVAAPPTALAPEFPLAAEPPLPLLPPNFHFPYSHCWTLHCLKRAHWRPRRSRSRE